CDDGADVRRDRAGGTGRTARDLRPGLSQRMDGGPGEAAADDRELIEVIRGVRHQPLRESEVAAEEGRGGEVGGSPGAFLQIPRIDLTRRAGKKDEDAVLRRGAKRDVRSDR